MTRTSEATEHWRKCGTSLSTARVGCGAVSIGRRIFVFGGVSGSNPAVEIIKMDNEGLAPPEYLKTKMKRGRTRCAAAVLGRNKVVVLGGGPKQNDATAELYNTVTGKWSDMPKMKSRRKGCAIVGMGSSVYVFGGSLQGGPPCEMYSEAADKWVTIAPMRTPRTNCAAVALDDDTILVMGGKDPRTSEPLNTVEAYNIQENTWSSFSPMTTPRSGCAAVSVGGLIFAIGGKHLSSFELYDHQLNTWRILSSTLLQKRELLAAVSLQGKKMVALGGQNHRRKPFRTLEELDLGTLLLQSSTAAASPSRSLALPPLPAPVYTSFPETRATALETWAESVQSSMDQIKQDQNTKLSSLEEARVAALKPLQDRLQQVEEEIRKVEEMYSQRKEKEDQNVSVTQRWLEDAAVRRDCAQLEAAELRQQLQDQDKEVQTPSHTPDNMEIPDYLCCKITGELMQDPTVAMDGHTYERRAILQWYATFSYEQQPRSPVTNEVVPSRMVVPNFTVKKQCFEFSDSLRDA